MGGRIVGAELLFAVDPFFELGQLVLKAFDFSLHPAVFFILINYNAIEILYEIFQIGELYLKIVYILF